MITNIEFFIDTELDIEALKPILAEMSDVIDRYGHATDGDIHLEDDPVKTIILARILNEEDLNTKELIVNLMENSLMIVVPMTSKEKNDASGDS